MSCVRKLELMKNSFWLSIEKQFPQIRRCGLQSNLTVAVGGHTHGAWGISASASAIGNHRWQGRAQPQDSKPPPVKRYFSSAMTSPNTNSENAGASSSGSDGGSAAGPSFLSSLFSSDSDHDVSTYDNPADRGIGSAANYWKAMESCTRIALAGFGGALAGLSVSRRRSSLQAMNNSKMILSSPASGRGSTRRGGSNRRAARTPRSAGRATEGSHMQPRQASKPYVDQDLPTTWAMACVTFAGIVECTRLVSPSKIVGELATRGSDHFEDKKDEDAVHVEQSDGGFHIGQYFTSQDAYTVADYVLGGSVAGAIFKGSSIQTSAGERLARVAAAAGKSKSAETAASAAARGGIGAGLLPGATLGLIAGILQVSANHLEELVEEPELSHVQATVQEEEISKINEEESSSSDVRTAADLIEGRPVLDKESDDKVDRQPSRLRKLGRILRLCN